MRSRALAIAGLALVTALGVAGCREATTTAPDGARVAATAAPALSPADELRAAAEKLGEDTVRVEMEMGSAFTGEGVMDPQARKLQMAMTMSAQAGSAMSFDVRMIDTDLYLKVGGPLGAGLGGKWLHLAADDLTGGSFDLMPDGDPAGARRMLAAMVTVERDGATGFRGTIDLTKSPAANKAMLDSLGAKATAVPFTATVDAQGRLVAMNIDMAAITPAAGMMKVRYSGFGVSVDVTAPPKSQVTEATGAMRGLLNA